jgi:hypothetical protein
MVGTIFGLGMSQQQDADGNPYVGAKLYLYQAGTSTEVTSYKDYGLTTGQEHQHPIVADSAGRIPAFWLADGSYRVRLTDANGNEVFDESSITAIGASSGTASGGGVSSESIFQTGDMIFTYDEGTRTGWLKAFGSIGNSASSGTNRANSDCEALFAFLWNNISDTYAPVSSGRGASAAADWAAAKNITIPSMAGRVPLGIDDLSGTAASVVAAATEIGYAAGTETVTIAETNLPSHTHGSGSLTVASHSHSSGSYAVGAHTHGAGSFAAAAHTHGAGSYTAASHTHTVSEVGRINANNLAGGGTNARIGETTKTTSASGALTVSGTSSSTSPAVAGTSGSSTPSFSGSSGAAAPAVDSGVTGATGSGTALAVMPPYRAGGWYIKL